MTEKINYFTAWKWRNVDIRETHATQSSIKFIYLFVLQTASIFYFICFWIAKIGCSLFFGGGAGGVFFSFARLPFGRSGTVWKCKLVHNQFVQSCFNSNSFIFHYSSWDTLQKGINTRLYCVTHLLAEISFHYFTWLY